MEKQRKFVSKIDSVVKQNRGRIYDAAYNIYEYADYLLRIFKSPDYKRKVQDAKLSYDSFISYLKVITNESDWIMARMEIGFEGFDRDDNFPINDSLALSGLEKEKKRVAIIQKTINEALFMYIADLYGSDRIYKAIREIKNNTKKLDTYFTQSINVVKRNAASKRK